MCKAGTTMAGNKVDGRLFSIGSNRYVGERRKKRGFETKRFKGTPRQAVEAWAEWRMA